MKCVVPKTFRSKGIQAFHSCVKSPQQNLVVERKCLQLLNVAKTLLFQYGIPLAYQGDCIQTIKYLINRTHFVIM